MSGHSKWANIKRKKAVVDAQKGKDFSKMAREITVAARAGGGNPDANFRLKAALEKAKKVNLPQDNIQRAIAKGTGADDGTHYEELQYEGYAAGGVAVLLDITTDNRNRTASDVRHLFHKFGGSLGESGCVSWMFRKLGRITVATDDLSDALLEAALGAGVLDVQWEDEEVAAYTEPDLQILQAATFALSSFGEVDSELVQMPDTRVQVAGDEADKVLRLLDALDELDDVAQVHANFDLSADEMARLTD